MHMLLELSHFLCKKGGESGGAVRLVDSESIGPVQKGGGAWEKGLPRLSSGTDPTGHSFSSS